MIEYGKKRWRKVIFEDYFPERKKNRIIGLTFPTVHYEWPPKNIYSALEPSILSVLPEGKNVEFSLRNHDFNDKDVELYLCSVYITGYDEFIGWAQKHNREKIIVGGYHPTTFPEEFKNYASKIVLGPCDDIYETIIQDGQIVKGITSFSKLPRYDLYKPEWNQQIIPDKKPDDIVVSLWTSQGCPFQCDFCCTPMMAPKLLQKPIKLVEKEVDLLKTHRPKFLFIRDENFTLQKDWQERLEIISDRMFTKVKIYLFASANTLKKEDIAFMKKHNVYMICLGLEEVTKKYKKNRNLDTVIKWIKEEGIYTYLSYIINPLDIIGREVANEYYKVLMDRIYQLAPEMICGNFLMPFRGTKIWDKYYAFIDRSDYKNYDSKHPLMIRNRVVQEKMKFFLFWHQWLYYNSQFYNRNVRTFYGDTLHLKFKELFEEFRPKYEKFWDMRP